MLCPPMSVRNMHALGVGMQWVQIVIYNRELNQSVLWQGWADSHGEAFVGVFPPPVSVPEDEPYQWRLLPGPRVESWKRFVTHDNSRVEAVSAQERFSACEVSHDESAGTQLFLHSLAATLRVSFPGKWVVVFNPWRISASHRDAVRVSIAARLRTLDRATSPHLAWDLPEHFAPPRECLPAAPDARRYRIMDWQILIPTYSRWRECLILLESIERAAGDNKRDLSVVVYNDATPFQTGSSGEKNVDPYGSVRQKCDENGWKYIRARKNRGPVGLWQTYNALHEEARATNRSAFAVLQDDFVVFDDFFDVGEEIVSLTLTLNPGIGGLVNPIRSRYAEFMHLFKRDLHRPADKRVTRKQAILKSPRTSPHPKLWQFGWLDEYYVGPREAFEVAGWRILEPLKPTRLRDTMVASWIPRGVGFYCSKLSIVDLQWTSSAYKPHRDLSKTLSAFERLRANDRSFVHDRLQSVQRNTVAEAVSAQERRDGSHLSVPIVRSPDVYPPFTPALGRRKQGEQWYRPWVHRKWAKHYPLATIAITAPQSNDSHMKFHKSLRSLTYLEPYVESYVSGGGSSAQRATEEFGVPRMMDGVCPGLRYDLFEDMLRRSARPFIGCVRVRGRMLCRRWPECIA